jgi:hypothetical protein
MLQRIHHRYWLNQNPINLHFGLLVNRYFQQKFQTTSVLQFVAQEQVKRWELKKKLQIIVPKTKVFL